MGLIRRGATWWICFTVDGKFYRKSTGTKNKRMAEAIYAKITTQLVEGKWFDVDEAKQHTFDELMDKFMNEHAVTQEPTTQLRYGVSLKHLKEYFEGMVLSNITAKHISAYIASRKEEGSSAASINRERAMLSKAFNLAFKQWEWCKENPCSRVPPLPENNEITRWLSEEEEENLLISAKSYLNCQLSQIITVALHTGMRLNEILGLQWNNVDLFRKTIIIMKSKNKKPRTIPMNQTVCDLLMNKSKVVNMSGYVFTTTKSTRIGTRNMTREWYKALKKAGIENMRFHDLRHTCATRLVQSGVDLYTVSKLLGHSQMSTTQRYAHHSPDSLRTFVKVLDNFQSRKETKINPT